MADTRTIAAFDLDGTLTLRDTLLPFLRLACGGSATYRAVLAESVRIIRGLLHSDGRDAAKEKLLTRLLAGRELASLEETAEAFADLVVTRRMRTDVKARVAAHKRAGHQLVLVSASPELYVAPVGRRLGFDAVLATCLEVTTDGRLTGRFEGRNCRGAEKVARLRAWMGEGPVFLYAYGDSAGDRELMALADTAVLVTRRQLPPMDGPERPLAGGY